jgi:hypothetical protein
MKTLLRVAVVGAFGLAAQAVFAQAPALINYQGRLLDGTNLVNGTTNIVTSLYTAVSGGSPIYVETNQNVVIVDGLYTLCIGDEAAGIENALTNSYTIYLEIEIGTQTLVPRERIQSAPYAIHARHALTSAASLDSFQQINGILATNTGNRLYLRGTNLISVSAILPDTLLLDASLPLASNVVWVAMNGRTGGSGAIDDPLDTVQAGYDRAAALSGPATLAIAAGKYGALNFHGTNVHVIGFGRPELGNLDVKNGACAVHGKLRLFNLVFTNACVFRVNATQIKMHQCRMEEGITIRGDGIELQNCYATNSGAPAITIGDGVNPCKDISINNSAFALNDLDLVITPCPTMLVESNVDCFAVVQCEIVRIKPTGIPGIGYYAIWDRESGSLAYGSTISNLHLYAHNYIKGPISDEASGLDAAVMDHGLSGNPPGGSIIAFHHNVVYGDVGFSPPAGGQTTQYYSHNMVYGAIAWLQALNGAGDLQYNYQHFRGGQPLMPDPWDD